MRAWWRRCWLLVLVAAIAPACHRTPYTGPTSTYTHPTIGLTLTVPRKLGALPVQVDNTPDGFVVQYASHPLQRVTVQFKAGIAAPLGRWPKTRTVGDVDLHYMIQDMEGGGSSGEEYKFTAWRPARNGHLLYGQVDMSEMGEPHFDLAWSVIEGTKVSP